MDIHFSCEQSTMRVLFISRISYHDKGSHLSASLLVGFTIQKEYCEKISLYGEHP